MAKVTSDFSEPVKVVRTIYKAFGDEFRKERAKINAAAGRAAKPAGRYAKQQMLTHRDTTPKASQKNRNKTGFSKLKQIAQLIKPYPKKRHPIKEKDAFGTRLRMEKGVGIQYLGAKGKYITWNAQGWAKLIMEGSHKVGTRYHKSGKSTGKTKGMGNVMRNAEKRFAAIMKKNWRRQIIKSAIRAGDNAAKRRTRQNKPV